MAKKRVEKQETKNETKRKREKKEDTRTKSDYERKLQKEINTIVRHIDRGHKCISSNRNLNRKYDAGHYYSVGSNATLRFNLHNIFAQSVTDNQYKGGNPLEYIENVKNIFGQQYAAEVINLRKTYKTIHLSKEELKLCIGRARKFIKFIEEYRKKNNYYKFTLEERIELRREGNIFIGIYN